VIPAWYFKRLKANALKRAMLFEVTAKGLSALLDSQGGRCIYTDLPLVFGASTSSASVDRINSSLGYVAGNLQWVHRDVNFMKSTLGDDRFVLMCRLVARHCLARKIELEPYQPDTVDTPQSIGFSAAARKGGLSRAKSMKPAARRKCASHAASVRWKRWRAERKEARLGEIQKSENEKAAR
jgi:hypothetical protein